MAILEDIFLHKALGKKKKFKYGSSAGRDEHGYSLRIGEVMVPRLNLTSIESGRELGYGVPDNYLEGAGYAPIYAGEEPAKRYIVEDETDEVRLFFVPPDSDFAIITMEQVAYPKGYMGTLWNKSSFPATLRTPLVDGGFGYGDPKHLTLRGRNPDPYSWLVLAQGTGCMVIVCQEDPSQKIGYKATSYSEEKRYD